MLEEKYVLQIRDSKVDKDIVGLKEFILMIKKAKRAPENMPFNWELEVVQECKISVTENGSINLHTLKIK